MDDHPHHFGISHEEDMEIFCQAEAEEDQKTGPAEGLMAEDDSSGSLSPLELNDAEEDKLSQAWAALCEAASTGVSEVLNTALSGIGTAALREDLCGLMGSHESPLMLALVNGNYACVKFLLDIFGISPDLCVPEGKGYTLLLNIAARGGHNDIVELLLDRGANVNLSGTVKRTPLYEACCHNHVSTVELLLGRGADPNIFDIFGDSCLSVADRKGYREILKLLLRVGAGSWGMT